MSNKFYKIGISVMLALCALIGVLIFLANKSDKQAMLEEENLMSIESSANQVEDNTTVSTEKFEEIAEIANNSTNETSNKSADSNSVSTDATNKSEKSKSSNSNNSSSKKTEGSQKSSNGENDSAKKEDSEKNNSEEISKIENSDPVFKYPVEGEIMTEYAKEKLIYSNTLSEWITHNGIDIKAEKKSVVKASASGTVKAIKNDPRYGLTIVIEHTNGFSSVYANLLSTEFVSVGEKVNQGDAIGTVGNTAAFEILEEPHLHFEILKSSEAVDPLMYLK